MKVCPYCREEVRDEAIKCRYCSSSLLPAQPLPEQPTERPADGSNRVVFIVDNDLIRFAKFVAAALAVFVTIGVSLYGSSINQAADKVRDAGEKSRDLVDKIRDVADLVRAQREAVDSQRGAVDSQAKAIATTAEQVRSAKDDVDNQAKTVELTAQQINDAATKVAVDSQRVKDLRKQTEQDALQAHSFSLSITAIGPRKSVATSIKSFSVPELTLLYNFPTEFDGKGQTIALIELGGGFLDSDLNTYFAKLKVPRPKVTWVSVGGVGNEPGKASGPSSQVSLDIEVVGAAAPGANIVVYGAKNTNVGYVDALNQAVHDRNNHPSVILLSWGASEESWDSSALQAADAVLQEATALGITVVAAIGNNGITDGAEDGKPHVDFPASSPHVLAVGGSRLSATKEAIVSEVAWIGSGSGVSLRFLQPKWQEAAKIVPLADGGNGRRIPDVVINADPSSGITTIIGGKSLVIGGTPVGAALWAGLIARINQGAGYNIGYINPVLYEKIGPGGTLRSIEIEGNIAGSGWNAVTGWGSPDGRKLLTAFQNVPSPRGASSAR